MIFLNSNDELQFKFLEYFEMSITKFWKIYSTVIDVKTTIFFDEEWFSDSYFINFFLGHFSSIDFLLLLGFS